MNNRQEWIIIGIGGVTCGGKTTLANKLMNALCPVYVFNQDKYFYPDDSSKHVKCDTLAHNNYDILSSLDMESMYSDVMNTVTGQNKAHGFNLNTDGKFCIDGKKFLIIEGFTVLNYKPLLEICDLRYYVALEYSECVLRRSHRLYDPPDIDGYFDLCVWPEHIKYRTEIEKDKRITLLDGATSDTFDVVMNQLRASAATSQ